MPLPRSLAHLKREISEKWVEARQWAGGWTCKTKYRMPGGRGRAALSSLFRLLSFVISLGASHLLGTGLQRAATVRTADRKRTVHDLAMI